MLEAVNLSKRYGDQVALDSLNLLISPGDRRTHISTNQLSRARRRFSRRREPR